MKRTVLVSLLLAMGALPGCPIYGEDDVCVHDSDCPSTYFCEPSDGLCRPRSSKVCTRPSGCDLTETCSSEGFCKPGDCSWSDIGCVAGYECSSSTGTWSCLPEGSGSGGSGSGGNGSGGNGSGGSAGQAGESSSSGGSDATSGGGAPT